MNRVYLATVIAVFVTLLLATNVLLIAMCGSAASRASSRLRSVLRRIRGRLTRLIDVGITAMTARRERQVVEERADQTASPMEEGRRR